RRDADLRPELQLDPDPIGGRGAADRHRDGRHADAAGQADAHASTERDALPDDRAAAAAVPGPGARLPAAGDAHAVAADRRADRARDARPDPDRDAGAARSD